MHNIGIIVERADDRTTVINKLMKLDSTLELISIKGLKSNTTRIKIETMPRGKRLYLDNKLLRIFIGFMTETLIIIDNAIDNAIDKEDLHEEILNRSKIVLSVSMDELEAIHNKGLIPLE